MQVEQLAQEFSRLLRRDLSEHEMSEVIARNATTEYSGCCATHDFLDANMTMFEAFQNVVGREVIMSGDVEENPDLDNQESSDIALWNSSWALAIKNNFY
jgi:hypothetical protein